MSHQPDNGPRPTQGTLGSYTWAQNTNPSKHHHSHFREFIFTVHLHMSKLCAFKGIHCWWSVMAKTENNPVSTGRRWLGTLQSIHTRAGRAWQGTRKLYAQMWIVCWDAHNSASKFRTDKKIYTYICLHLYKKIKVFPANGWEGE